MTASVDVSVRLDLWLWAARFYKTRALAKHAIEAGKVLFAGQAAKPSRQVKLGENLEIHRGDERFEISVIGLSERRGPASVAQTLYDESEVSRLRRVTELAERRAAMAGYRPPSSKPDKRARRLIQALGDLDAM